MRGGPRRSSGAKQALPGHDEDATLPGSFYPLHRQPAAGGIFKSAAVEVLRRTRRLMTTGEICRLALEWGLLNCSGKTPEATMASAMYGDIKRKDRDSIFIRPQEGMFGLREWVTQGYLPYCWQESAPVMAAPVTAAAAAPAAAAVMPAKRGPRSGRDAPGGGGCTGLTAGGGGKQAGGRRSKRARRGRGGSDTDCSSGDESEKMSGSEQLGPAYDEEHLEPKQYSLRRGEVGRLQEAAAGAGAAGAGTGSPARWGGSQRLSANTHAPPFSLTDPYADSLRQPQLQHPYQHPYQHPPTRFPVWPYQHTRMGMQLPYPEQQAQQAAGAAPAAPCLPPKELQPLDLPNLRPASAGREGRSTSCARRGSSAGSRGSGGGGGSGGSSGGLLSPPLYTVLQSPHIPTRPTSSGVGTCANLASPGNGLPDFRSPTAHPPLLPSRGTTPYGLLSPLSPLNPPPLHSGLELQCPGSTCHHRQAATALKGAAAAAAAAAVMAVPAVAPGTAVSAMVPICSEAAEAERLAGTQQQQHAQHAQHQLVPAAPLAFANVLGRTPVDESAGRPQLGDGNDAGGECGAAAAAVAAAAGTAVFGSSSGSGGRSSREGLGIPEIVFRLLPPTDGPLKPSRGIGIGGSSGGGSQGQVLEVMVDAGGWALPPAALPLPPLCRPRTDSATAHTAAPALAAAGSEGGCDRHGGAATHWLPGAAAAAAAAAAAQQGFGLAAPATHAPSDATGTGGNRADTAHGEAGHAAAGSGDDSGAASAASTHVSAAATAAIVHKIGEVEGKVQAVEAKWGPLSLKTGQAFYLLHHACRHPLAAPMFWRKGEDALCRAHSILQHNSHECGGAEYERLLQSIQAGAASTAQAAAAPARVAAAGDGP